MNVLHEIDIEEWEETFSDINKILTDDGFLLVFEVVKLMHGEQPYGNSGYILFGEEQMKVLFDASDIKSIDIGQDDKTNLFIIPKKIIKNVTLDSILGALKLLELRLDDELRRLYLERCKKAHNRQNVLVDTIKYYGFLSQHYLNCKFAVEIIEKKHTLNSKNAIELIMRQISSCRDTKKTEALRAELIRYNSEEDKKIISQYLETGNSLQRKSARYYFIKNK